MTGVIAQAGVLALADCAREHVGGTAALDLMGGGPDELPEAYRLADPIAAVPIPAPVLCLHSRADADVPYSYSERYVAAATAAGGRASLVELTGDHFTLIDPASPDWAAAIAALPTLISLALRCPSSTGVPSNCAAPCCAIDLMCRMRYGGRTSLCRRAAHARRQVFARSVVKCLLIGRAPGQVVAATGRL